MRAAELKALVRGRRIAIIGRAGSIVGTGNGPAIDAADVVIRINWLLPTLPEHLPDMGERTDLVYTCSRCRTARQLAAEHGVPSYRITARFRKKVSEQFFRNRPDYRVSTGLLCAVQTVRLGAARIGLYGFDLQRSEHVQERTPDGHNAGGNRKRTWWHLWDVERDAWVWLINRHPDTLIPDRIFREVLV